MGKNKKGGTVRWIAMITVWTLILAALIGFVTQILVDMICSLVVSFLILVAVILLGIIFDLIGTAAAAADIAPLNAKAARKIEGARRGVYLVQHAERVSNFCNDVVGDISGIVSGALAAIIVIRVAASWPLERAELYAGIILTAVVAALTVGGKAWGKNIAINRPTEVILIAGSIINQILKPFQWISRRRG